MAEIGPRDTTAWKVVRQIIDHTWGMDAKVTDGEFLEICKRFQKNGGVWEGLMNDDMDSVRAVEEAIDSFMRERDG